MNYKTLLTLLGIVIVLFLSFPSQTQAQPSPTVCTQGIVPCGKINPATGKREFCNLCHVPQLALNIIQFLFICIIPVIAVIAIVGAGITIMVSGGNPALMNRAKSILKNTIIGIVIAYTAWLLVGAFLAIIGLSGDLIKPSTWFKLDLKCGPGTPSSSPSPQPPSPSPSPSPPPPQPPPPCPGPPCPTP